MRGVAGGGKVRLLMSVDCVGGVWTYALDLAHALADHRMDVCLAVLGPAPSADQRSQAAIQGVTLIETGLPLDWLAEAPSEIVRAGEAIARLAEELDVDLVHLNSPALAAGVQFGVPVVGACHSCLATWWSAAGEGSMPADFVWRTASLWRGLIACQALVAPSHSFALDVSRSYDVPLPFVVHNGRRVQAAPAVQRARMVLGAGRLWDRGKNFAALDAAGGCIDAPLLLAGPLTGPSNAEFRAAFARSAGALPPTELRRLMKQASVFASTSLYEPFGLTVLEAAQAGCALVLSDIATFRELWEGVALFVPATGTAAIAEAVQLLLDDPQTARAHGDAARRRARRYGLESMARSMVDVYRPFVPAVGYRKYDVCPDSAVGAEATA